MAEIVLIRVHKHNGDNTHALPSIWFGPYDSKSCCLNCDAQCGRA